MFVFVIVESLGKVEEYLSEERIFRRFLVDKDDFNRK